MRTHRLLAVVLLLALGRGATAAPPPRPQPTPVPQTLLGHLVEAPPVYTGIRSVVAWSPAGARAVQYEETREGNRVRMEFHPNAELGPAILVGDRVRWQVYQPQAQWCDEAPASPAQLQTRLEQAFQSYAWQMLGPSEVAGRPAWVVQARARYPGGFRNVFWIDREYPMVLRRDKYDSQDRMVYCSTFLTISYQQDIEDHAFQGAIDPESTPAPPAPAAAPADPDFKPRLLVCPMPCFREEHSGDLPPRLAGRAGHHTIYSDGLESVSLFQFSGQAPVRLHGASQEAIAGCPTRIHRGAEGNLVSWSDGFRSYLVVSSLPLATVKPVVEQLAPDVTSPTPGVVDYLCRGWNRVLGFFGWGRR